MGRRAAIVKANSGADTVSKNAAASVFAAIERDIAERDAALVQEHERLGVLGPDLESESAAAQTELEAAQQEFEHLHAHQALDAADVQAALDANEDRHRRAERRLRGADAALRELRKRLVELDDERQRVRREGIESKREANRERLEPIEREIDHLLEAAIGKLHVWLDWQLMEYQAAYDLGLSTGLRTPRERCAELVAAKFHGLLPHHFSRSMRFGDEASFAEAPATR